MGAVLLGDGEFKRELAKLAGLTVAAGENSIRAAGARIGEAMETRAPELSDEYEGSIARSIQTRDAGVLAIEVGTDHGLAAVFEYGGELTPTRRQVLASQEQDIVFGEQVTIPAQPFIHPAIDESEGEAGRAAAGGAANVIRRLT